MAQYCTFSDTRRPYFKRDECPVNGQQYASVSPTTIFAPPVSAMQCHATPWMGQPVEQGYYFCNDPECDVVYFAQDD